MAEKTRERLRGSGVPEIRSKALLTSSLPGVHVRSLGSPSGGLVLEFRALQALTERAPSPQPGLPPLPAARLRSRGYSPRARIADPVVVGGGYHGSGQGLGFAEHAWHPADTYPHVTQQFPDCPRRPRARAGEIGLIRPPDHLGQAQGLGAERVYHKVGCHDPDRTRQGLRRAISRTIGQPSGRR